MHITCPTPELAAAARHCKVVDRTSVQLTATTDDLRLVAEDDTVRTERHVPGDEIEPGSYWMPTLTLHRIASNCPAPTVTIDRQGDRLIITAGETTHQVVYDDQDRAPSPVEIDRVWCTATGDEVARAKNFVHRQISTEWWRSPLIGAQLGVGYLVASDGHRLAVRRCPWATGERRAVLPRRFWRVLDDAARRCKIDDVTFRTTRDGRITAAGVTTTPIAGDFPGWRTVHPGVQGDEVAWDVEFDPDSLRRAAWRVQASTPNNSTIVLGLGDGDTLRLWTGVRVATAVSAVDALVSYGEERSKRVVVDHAYLHDALLAIGSYRTHLSVYRGDSPVMLSCASGTHVIMPIFDCAIPESE